MMDAVETGLGRVDWIGMVQDRELVNAILDLRVL
jgi:hypothetical protein